MKRETCLKLMYTHWEQCGHSITVFFVFFFLMNKMLHIGPLASWLECSPMVWETGVQSQVESYQRLKKMVLDASLLNTGIIKYGSRVSGAIQGKELHPPPHLGVVAIEKGAFGSLLTMVGQLAHIIWNFCSCLFAWNFDTKNWP